jgi:predicted metal-dependent enzyme (double-stranded beta helix superfamily)
VAAPEHRIGDPARYMRHLLYVDPDGDFVMSVLVWLPGQQSPIHGHEVWCAYGVVEGELTEEQYRAAGNGIEPARRPCCAPATSPISTSIAA